LAAGFRQELRLKKEPAVVDFSTVRRNRRVETRTITNTQKACQARATRCGQSVADFAAIATIDMGELKGKI
jgi:hypothetical protein